MTTRHLFALALALCSVVAASSPVAAQLVGDWVGWAYLTQGGDFPLRLHVVSEGDTTRVTLDLPHARMFDVAPDSFHVDNSRLHVVRVNSKGERWEFTGRLRAKSIPGSCTFEGEPYGEFELHRSPVQLPTVDPQAYADAAGIYRFDSGRKLVLYPRFWGEMLYHDLGTGRYGTLFATSPESFFAGAAMYVPHPVLAQLKLLRNTEKQLTGLSWQEGASAPEFAIKMPLLEERVTFSNGDVTLAGTLLKPSGAGPHPAAVVIGGSGWTTRDRSRGDADLLAAMGLATLVFDKRGHGESSGERTVPFSDIAADALAAVTYLRTRVDINPQQVGLTGRSRGGWHAPLAAASSDAVAFLVLFVPPAVSPAEQEQTRRLNKMRQAGADESALQQAEQYLEMQWRFARNEENWPEYAAARAQMDSLGWQSLVGGPAVPDPEVWKWARLNMHYDPLPALQKVTVPVLAFFGGADHNVVAEINKPRMEAALTAAGNQDFTLVVVAGADHALNQIEKMPTRLHQRTHLAPGVWSQVQEWLEARLDLVANVSRKRGHSAR